MAANLPDPAEWLAEQLAKKHMTQNEAAAAADLSSGTLTKFAKGHVNEKAAVKIANFFNVPAQLTLAMMGLAPPPASMANVEADRLVYIFSLLDAEKKEKLISYAEFLSAQP